MKTRLKVSDVLASELFYVVIRRIGSFSDLKYK